MDRFTAERRHPFTFAEKLEDRKLANVENMTATELYRWRNLTRHAFQPNPYEEELKRRIRNENQTHS